MSNDRILSELAMAAVVLYSHCYAGCKITLGMGWDGMGWDGMGWDGIGSDRVGSGGVGWGGVGWDGVGWDGVGWGGVGWGSMGWDGVGWDGVGNWEGRFGGEGRERGGYGMEWDQRKPKGECTCRQLLPSPYPILTCCSYAEQWLGKKRRH